MAGEESVVAVPESSPPVEAPVAEGQPAQPTEGTAPEVTEEQPKPERSFTQADLDRILAKERAKAERRAERFGYERAMREAAERQLQSHAPPPPVPSGDGRPTPDKFQTYDQYVEALSDWKVEQKLISVGAKAREAREQQTAEQQAAEVRSKLAPASEKYDDFEEVVLRDDLPITQDMAEAALELGTVGHDVLYHLGTHPKEAARIAGLGRVAQIKAIDKIAETLTKPPSPTKAPPPIVPNAGTATVEKRLEEADFDEFVKIRRKQIAARR